MHLTQDKPATGSTEKTSLPADQLLTIAQNTLDDNKAEEITTISLSGKTSIADYMVIANGRTQRQVGALANYITEAIKKAGHDFCQVEGQAQADWVLIDAGDVIVHIFRPEVRSFYNLEKMWSVDLSDNANDPV